MPGGLGGGGGVGHEMTDNAQRQAIGRIYRELAELKIEAAIAEAKAREWWKEADQVVEDTIRLRGKVERLVDASRKLLRASLRRRSRNYSMKNV